MTFGLPGDFQATALMLAVVHGHQGVVDELLRLASAQQLSKRDMKGRTPGAVGFVGIRLTQTKSLLKRDSLDCFGFALRNVLHLATWQV